MLQTSVTTPTSGTPHSATEAQLLSLSRRDRAIPRSPRERPARIAGAPQSARQPTARWILAAPSIGQNSYTEFVITGGATATLRSDLLRTLARLGPFPFSLRLQAAGDDGPALEVRIGDLDQEAADRIAQAVAKAPGVRRVCYRGSAFGGQISARLSGPGALRTEPRLAKSA